MGPGVLGAGAAEHGVHDRGVGDGTRQGTCIDVVAEGVARGVGRHRAQRWLQPDQPAARSRTAHRARTVGAERQRPQPGRHGGSTTAARAARRAFEIPRIASDAERRPVGQSLDTEFRCRRLADDDRAGSAQAADQHIVAGGDIVLEDRRAVARMDARDIDQVLDADRHAVQRSELGAFGHRLLGDPGVSPRLVCHHHAKAIELGLRALDRLQDGFHIIDRRELPGADKRGGLGGGHELQIGIGHEAGFLKATEL